MAKTRKAASAKKKKTTSAKRSVAKKSTGSKKQKATRAPRKTAAAKPTKELDLRPLKKQIRAHVEMLSRATGGDARVSGALASLQRVYAELNEECLPTMTIPLA